MFNILYTCELGESRRKIFACCWSKNVNKASSRLFIVLERGRYLILIHRLSDIMLLIMPILLKPYVTH